MLLTIWGWEILENFIITYPLWFGVMLLILTSYIAIFSPDCTPPLGHKSLQKVYISGKGIGSRMQSSMGS